MILARPQTAGMAAAQHRAQAQRVPQACHGTIGRDHAVCTAPAAAATAACGRRTGPLWGWSPCGATLAHSAPGWGGWRFARGVRCCCCCLRNPTPPQSCAGSTAALSACRSASSLRARHIPSSRAHSGWPHNHLPCRHPRPCAGTHATAAGERAWLAEGGCCLQGVQGVRAGARALQVLMCQLCTPRLLQHACQDLRTHHTAC